jgi:hypothetical protein
MQEMSTETKFLNDLEQYIDTAFISSWCISISIANGYAEERLGFDSLQG